MFSWLTKSGDIKNRLPIPTLKMGKEACFQFGLFYFYQFKLLKFFICHVPQLSDYPIGQLLHIRIIKVRQDSFNILYDLASTLPCIYAD